LFGNIGDDALAGGVGNDQLAGGIGVDSFIFEANSGQDVVADFDVAAGEVIDLSALGLGDDFASFAASSITDNGDGNALVDLGGGNVITLIGVQADDLQAGNFLL
jgi:Ca2+-binding RTX toxin-like protein